MSRRSPSGGESAVVLGDAFQQVAQGLARIQEALQLQGQEVERRIQDAMQRQEQEADRKHQESMQRQEQEAERRLNESLRAQEQRAATALREAVAQMEVKLEEKDSAIRALQQQVEEIKGREALSEGKTMDLEGAAKQLEDRVQAVEVSLQRTLQTFFPRVDGLLRQLEETPPQGATYSLPSPTASAGNTCAVAPTGVAAAGGREENPRPSTSRASSTSPSATASALTASAPEGAAGDRGGEAGADQVTGDLDEMFQRRRVQLRIHEAKEGVKRTRYQQGEDLHKAAVEGRTAEVRRLLDCAADVNYVDNVGGTPLMLAQDSARNEDVVALLLQRGADVNAVDICGRTALHWAAWRDESGRCVDLLVAAGGGVNARNGHGSTPLHFAACRNKEAAVRAFLSAGARRDLKAWDGPYKNMTPFDIATTPAIRDLLRS